MIAFDLECSNGHTFEGWFDNLESYEEQNKKNMISCPYCNNVDIRKVLSPVVMKKSNHIPNNQNAESVDYKRLAKEVMDYINTEFEELGARFTTEALKMHYGVTEKRNIKGTASVEEEKILRDEGVQFFKVPLPIIDEDKKN